MRTDKGFICSEKSVTSSDSNTPDPQKLFDSIMKQQLHAESKLPPVHKWNPPLSGDLDMRIDREGRWFYQGGEITRHALVKLFSTILKRVDDDYYLVTPVENWRIQVDVAPFAAHSLKVVQEGGVAGLLFTLNDDSEVLLSDDDGLWVEDNIDAPIPMLKVRHGLNALINRNVFYQLADLAEQEGDSLWVSSMGKRFLLGRFD